MIWQNNRFDIDLWSSIGIEKCGINDANLLPAECPTLYVNIVLKPYGYVTPKLPDGNIAYGVCPFLIGFEASALHWCVLPR